MANTNPGPAVTGNANSLAVYTPVNTQVNSNPQGLNALRTLAVGRALNVNVTGDVGVLPIINATKWNVQAVLWSNMTNTAGTSVALALTSAALGAATTIVAATIISSIGTGTYGGVTTCYRPIVQNISFVGTGNNIYVHCSTTAGTACTIDVFVLGYDLS
jgi:hypothetical protein